MAGEGMVRVNKGDGTVIKFTKAEADEYLVNHPGSYVANREHAAPTAAENTPTAAENAASDAQAANVGVMNKRQLARYAQSKGYDLGSASTGDQIRERIQALEAEDTGLDELIAENEELKARLTEAQTTGADLQAKVDEANARIGDLERDVAEAEKGKAGE